MYVQILFISGLGCVIGPKRTLNFFFQRHKIKASISFLGGIIVVLMGWPIVGIIIETYGFVLLFRQVLFNYFIIRYLIILLDDSFKFIIFILQWFPASSDKLFTKGTCSRYYFKYARPKSNFRHGCRRFKQNNCVMCFLTLSLKECI